ncbi:MAG: hypothetical protein HC842_04460 [Cytophagales bacterium]|nr:hypothetical protein [Cytophagales bacterium]
MPATGQAGRANRFVALALLSRSALYAGSIAKYGQVGLNGLVGIAGAPDSYFQKSLDASNRIVYQGGYSLYNAITDNKAENYRQLFLADNNSEVIFKRSFDGVSKGHSFNFFNVVQGYGAGWGSYLQPSLNW